MEQLVEYGQKGHNLQTQIQIKSKYLKRCFGTELEDSQEVTSTAITPTHSIILNRN